MKSAIFLEQKRPTEPRAARNIARKRRPRSHSPFTASPAGANGLKWNLDEMLSSYTASGTLPTPLSPTLPPQYEQKRLDDVLDHDDDIESDIDNLPMSLLLPTLPHIFDGREGHERQERGERGERSDRGEKLEKLEKLERLKEERVEKQKEEKLDRPRDDRDRESKSRTPLAHPLPKKPPTTVSSVLAGGNSGNSRTSKVRWVNRATNTDKPRFLLRITFKLALGKYKSIFGSPAKVQGLGIEPSQDSDVDDRQYWLNIAKETQEYGEKVQASDPLLSVIVQFDWLLVLCISHHHEEKSRISGRTASDRWHSLYKEISPFIGRIEKYIKANEVSDKQKSFLSFLVGILAVVKALVLKRVNGVLQTAIDAKMAKDHTSERNNTVGELQKQIIANYRHMEDRYAESQSFFANCPAPSMIFPKSWANRSASIPRISDEPLQPAADKYFLPLGPYSDLREGCAYLYGCLRGFADVFGSDINGGVRYNFQGGSKRN